MIFIRILDPLVFVNLVKYFLKTSETLQTILLHTMIPLVTFVAGGIIATYKQPGKALEALNQACLELHKGADGVSKTWSEVHIKGQVEFSDSFGK